ncbi:D-alanyl-D-alanine dipeptidase [soil metagenome]
MPKWDQSKGRPEPIAALNRIPEIENGEPLVDIRVVAPSLRILRPQVIPYVRQTVAEMCEKAALALPDGVFLGLVEGWRPMSRQQRIYDFMWSSALEAFPDRTKASLRRTVCRWVAPTDQPAPPGHCTGAAVDVWLVNKDGDPIDVSTPFDRFRAARTYALGLSEEAARNRMILVDAMLSAGFSNCRDEWWHYSYGDAGWAVRLDEKSCFYGLVHLDPALHAGLEAEHAESMKERVNPFLPPV